MLIYTDSNPKTFETRSGPLKAGSRKFLRKECLIFTIIILLIQKKVKMSEMRNYMLQETIKFKHREMINNIRCVIQVFIIVIYH